MTDPKRPVTARIPTAFTPRWGFWKGLLTGAVIEVPALAAGVWLLARIGIGDQDAGFMRMLRMSAVFTGIAALFTAGGVGRLAAHASAAGGRRGAVIAAARAHGAATAGLLIIAAIPLGHLPGHALKWLVYPLFGAAIGAVLGAVIGVVCSGTAPVGLADVWSIARSPAAALRQLLDPEDLVKLGHALRDRTTHLFEGMFEPAKRPPEPAKDEPKDAGRG